MKSILDPTFRYVPSADTDIRKTFDRVRREMARAERMTSRTGTSRVLRFGRDKAVAMR